MLTSEQPFVKEVFPMAVPAHELPELTTAPAAARPHLRLVPAPALSRGVYARRRISLVAALALVGVGVWAAWGLASPAPDVLDAPAEHVVVVGEGETVWGIAAEHVPAGTDLRAYVADVLALNDVRPAALTPGAVLRLP